MQRFSSELRDRFPHRTHIFDDYEVEVGQWEAAFREYATAAAGEEALLRVSRKLTARRLVAIQATNPSRAGR